MVDAESVRHNRGMCGRYVNQATTDDLVEEFDVEQVTGPELPPSWNIAPTDPVRVVLSRPPKAADGPGIVESTTRSGSCARSAGAWCRAGRRIARAPPG